MADINARSRDDSDNRLKRFPGSHLSAPLTYYPQKLVYDYFVSGEKPPVFVIREGVDLLKTVRNDYPNMQFEVEPGPVYASLLESCYSTPHMDLVPVPYKEITDMLDCALQDVRQCYKSTRKTHPALKRMKFDISEIQLKETARAMASVYMSYKQSVKIRSIIQRETLPYKKTVHGPHVIRNLRVYAKGELLAVIYSSNPDRAVILNYDQWVMLCDTISSRMMTLMVCSLNDHIQVDVLPTAKQLTTVYRWGDKLIRKHGADAYAVIGEFESIVTSIFVTFADSDILDLGTEYAESIRITAQEIEENYHIPASTTDDLVAILKSVTSVNILSELFGLRKHWGNPMVDASASGRAVQEKVRENLPINGYAVIDVLASFNRMVTLAYMERHKAWPRCSFPEDTESDYPLKKAWRQKSLRIPEKDVNHKHSHWAQLRFLCNCDMDQYQNELSYLSDKAISLPTDELDLVYVSGMVKYPLPTEQSKERRLILEYLRENQMSILDILKTVMIGEIPYGWLANTANMKGTEMKHEKARIFAVLPYETRQLFAITEDLIKKFIFPYNPHQTMTMSETELLAKLREVTRQMDVKSNKRYLNVMHIIDFSKWNLRMCQENTWPVFRSIDDFMGTPGLVERTHNIFAAMTNLVQDPYNPPPQPVAETESDTIWRNHTKGWEGQRQKGWTCLTSALLASVERMTGIKSVICGQGDNQTLLSSFPIPSMYRNASDWIENDKETVKKMLDDYYAKLDQMCSELGLKVKVAESCRSLTYFNYGKRLYFNGVELSMTLKRISKAMTESNDAFPTTENRLKTSQGASYAAGLYSNPSPWPYFVSRICSYLILWESYHTNPLLGERADFAQRRKRRRRASTPEVDNNFLAILMKIPSSLGGPPQQSFSSFLCRGHPDPLCDDLSILCLNAKNGCQISRAIIECARSGVWFKKDTKDKRTLITSPFSLNLCTPNSAQLPITTAIIPALDRHCHNEVVKGLLSSDVTEYEEKILTTLASMTPMNPLIANDIYSRTIAGQRRSFVDGLKNATSLCRLVLDSAENPVVEQVMRCEAHQLSYWEEMVVQVKRKLGKPIEEIPMHHELADQLRIQSWGMELVGITVPHPLELFKLVESPDNDCESHEEVGSSCHILFARHSDDLFAPPGSDTARIQLQRSRKGKPYLGGRVAEGITSKQIVCKTPTSAWEDACRLNVLKNWISSPGTEMFKFIEDIIKTRTDASIELLDMATGHPSRFSYSHRASLLSSRKTCSLTTTSNMLTRIYVSSNMMGQFSEGDLNYHLPFGPAFLTFEALLALEGVLDPDKEWNESKLKIYHCHLATEDVPIVYDGEIDLNLAENCELGMAPPPLLYTEVDTLVFDSIGEGLEGTDFAPPATTSLENCKTAYGVLLLGDSLVREVTSHEMMASEVAGYYVRRDTTISVGDVRMTGLTGLVRAIANSVLLASTAEIHQCRNREEFFTSLKTVLDRFSSIFWSSITVAIIKPSLISKLKQLAKPFELTSDGRQLSSLNEALKFAVIVESWDMVCKLRASIIYHTESPLNIFVPNLNALKYMLSRYAESVIWNYFIGTRISDSEAIAIGRSIVRMIHDYETESTSTLVVFTHALVNNILAQGAEGDLEPRMPQCLLFNLNDPWVDRLRNTSFLDPEPYSLTITSKSTRQRTFTDSITVSLHQQELLIPLEECSCVWNDDLKKADLSLFYIRTGKYGNLATSIVEILMRFHIPVKSAVVFGDSSGSIAQFLTALEDCSGVMTFPCRLTTDFDPHVLGSYIPPAFTAYSNVFKLIKSASAAIAGDPFEHDDARQRAVFLMGDYNWQGWILDCVTDGGTRTTSQLGDMLKELALCQPLTEWVLVRVKVACEHQARLWLTVVGGWFKELQFIRSPMSSPHKQEYFILGTIRRSTPIRVSENEGFVSLVSDNQLDMICLESKSSVVPKLARFPIKTQEKWLKEITYGELNLNLYSNEYLPGWVISHQIEDGADEIILELRNLRRAYLRALRAEKYGTEGLINQRPAPRNYALYVPEGNLTTNSSEILYKWVRCYILEQLLKCHSGDIGSALNMLVRQLSRTHSLTVDGEILRLNPRMSEFMRVYSPCLFGILGHVWRTGSFDARSRLDGISHYLDRGFLVNKDFSFPISLPLQETLPTPTDLKYEWPSRAKIMALFMVSAMCDGIPAVAPSLRQLGDDFSRIIGSELSGSGLRHEPNVLLYEFNERRHVGDLQEISQLPLSGFTTVFVLATDMSLLSLLANHSVSTIYRVPWTGRVPNTALVAIDYTKSVAKADRFVNFGETINVVYRVQTVTGCKCYDCSTEGFILSHFGLDVSVLEKFRTPAHIEDVMDLNHAF